MYGDNGQTKIPMPRETHTPLTDFLGSIQATSQQFPNALKDFTHPGHDPKELLMRTFFADSGAARAAVLMLHKIKRFGMKSEYNDLVMMLLAANTSIQGLSRRELLQAVTGVVAPDLYQTSRPKIFKPQEKGDE